MTNDVYNVKLDTPEEIDRAILSLKYGTPFQVKNGSIKIVAIRRELDGRLMGEFALA